LFRGQPADQGSCVSFDAYERTGRPSLFERLLTIGGWLAQIAPHDLIDGPETLSAYQLIPTIPLRSLPALANVREAAEVRRIERGDVVPSARRSEFIQATVR
jgi:hypothetical protein